VYAIRPGRGFEQAAAMLGADFTGFLVRWMECLSAVRASRASDLPSASAAPLPRDDRSQRKPGGAFSAGGAKGFASGAAIACAARPKSDRRTRAGGGLRPPGSANGSSAPPPPPCPAQSAPGQPLPPGARRTVHLPVLSQPIEATNWRAEQAIRPMVVTRKVWGGNRTPAGARAQSILLSVFQTCRQRHRSAVPLLRRLICSPRCAP
jgi:hypothetical protein